MHQTPFREAARLGFVLVITVSAFGQQPARLSIPPTGYPAWINTGPRGSPSTPMISANSRAIAKPMPR